MSLTGPYDANNVFARILRGQIPSIRLYEDETTLAFLDAFPQSLAHSLVISKWSQARNILEAEPDALCQVMTTTQRIARAIRTALTPDGLQIVQSNGAESGQTVFHLHIHIIPRWKGQSLGAHTTTSAPDPAAQQDLATRIAAAC